MIHEKWKFYMNFWFVGSRNWFMIHKSRTLNSYSVLRFLSCVFRDCFHAAKMLLWKMLLLPSDTIELFLKNFSGILFTMSLLRLTNFEHGIFPVGHFKSTAVLILWMQVVRFLLTKESGKNVNIWRMKRAFNMK